MGDSLVEQVRNAMPPEDDLFEVAELFKAFGDSTRAKIICAFTILWEMSIFRKCLRWLLTT